MTYQDEVSKIASEVFYAWGGEIDERHHSEIDSQVSDHIAEPGDLARVLSESASADTVEPVDLGLGYKHGLAHAAMKRDVLNDIAEMARDAREFGEDD